MAISGGKNELCPEEKAFVQNGLLCGPGPSPFDSPSESLQIQNFLSKTVFTVLSDISFRFASCRLFNCQN